MKQERHARWDYNLSKQIQKGLAIHPIEQNPKTRHENEAEGTHASNTNHKDQDSKKDPYDRVHETSQHTKACEIK